MVANRPWKTDEQYFQWLTITFHCSVARSCSLCFFTPPSRAPPARPRHIFFFFACIINLTSLKHCTLDNAGNLKAIYHLEMMNSDIESKLMWYWMICGNIYLNRWSDFALVWPNLPFCYGCDDWKSFVLLWSTKTICHVKVCCEQRLREYPKGQEKLLHIFFV